MTTQNKVNSVQMCLYCKKLIEIGQEHECSIWIIDMDSGKYELREAIVKSKVDWKPDLKQEKKDEK